MFNHDYSFNILKYFTFISFFVKASSPEVCLDVTFQYCFTRIGNGLFSQLTLLLHTIFENINNFHSKYSIIGN